METTNEGFEAVEFREPALQPGERYTGPTETSLGRFDVEQDAIGVAREAWQGFLANPTKDVAWWLVRAQGEELARWIAESRSDVERVLDLTTNQLVAVRR
ncbi:MAG: hypothetical protein GY720_03615 [bacterium]|nr:hypothetical protein [bacterium]